MKTRWMKHTKFYQCLSKESGVYGCTFSRQKGRNLCIVHDENLQEIISYVKAKVIALYEVEMTWLNTDLTNNQLRTK